MDMNLLKKLCILNGTSGDEGAVREEIVKMLPDDCDYTVDALGNLIVNKKGESFPIKAGLETSSHIVLERNTILSYILRKMDFIC